MTNATPSASSPALLEDRLGVFAASQMVVRIVPDLPKGSPRNVAFPALEKFNSRRFFSVSNGFVPLDCEPSVEPAVIKFLKTVHVNGETTARGGRGGKLFEICTAQEASEIIVEEQRRFFLANGGAGSVMHAQLKGIVDEEAAASRELLAQRLAEQQIAVDVSNKMSAAVAAENADLKSSLAAVLARLTALEETVTAPKTITAEVTVDGTKFAAAGAGAGELALSNDLGAAIRAEELASQ